MSEYTEQYKDLLLFQYRQLPRAEAEIELMASQGEKILDLLKQYRIDYDVERAEGAQQDVLGRVLQIKRLDLDDEDYRLFQRIAIARNNGSGFVVSDSEISLQQVIGLAFPGSLAFIEDPLEMRLRLYVIGGVTLERMLKVINADLLPAPQGVGYDVVVHGSPKAEHYFGMSELLSFTAEFELSNGNPLTLSNDDTLYVTSAAESASDVEELSSNIDGFGELQVDTLELHTGEIVGLSNGENLGITDYNNDPIYPTIGGEISELIEV